MAVGLDDDQLARALKFDAFLVCPPGMTEQELRTLRNQLVGDRLRKQQFILGPGLNQLLSMARISCAEGKHHLLNHILTIVASLVSSDQAAAPLIDFEFAQIVLFVIRSTNVFYNTMLPALQILRSMVLLNPEFRLPLPELIKLAQSRYCAIPEICFEIFSRSTKEQIQFYSPGLISFCFSRLSSDHVLAYLEFIHFAVKCHFQWNPKKFPKDTFLYLVEHADTAVRLKAIHCVIDMPSLYRDLIPGFSHLLSKGCQVLIAFLSQKPVSCYFDEYCKALSTLLDHHQVVIPAAQPMIGVLMSNISMHSLDTLSSLAKASDFFRDSISSKLDSFFVDTWLRKPNDIYLSATNLIRILSRSLRPVRMKLKKLGLVQVLFQKLDTVCKSDSDTMSDTDKVSNDTYAVTLMSALANFFIDFNSMPRTEISEDHLASLVCGTRSGCASLREYACLALKNLCFNACFERVTEITIGIGILDMQMLLHDTSEQVRFHALGLIRNILLPETNRIFEPALISDLITQVALYLSSSNSSLILEAVYVLVNIAAGFRDRKILLLYYIDVLKGVTRLFDHCWPEIRLASLIFFENLFARAFMFKKKRMILEVPIDRLFALDLGIQLTSMQARELARGNHDAGARASRAAAGVETSLNVMRELLQSP